MRRDRYEPVFRGHRLEQKAGALGMVSSPDLQKRSALLSVEAETRLQIIGTVPWQIRPPVIARGAIEAQAMTTDRRGMDGAHNVGHRLSLSHN